MKSGALALGKEGKGGISADI